MAGDLGADPANQAVPARILRAFEPTARARECFDIANAHSEAQGWYCTLNPDAERSPSFILYGDSHALQLAQAFEAAARQTGRTGIFTGFSGCAPLPGTVPLTRSDQRTRDCRALNERIFQWAGSQRVKDIFLVGKWSYYTNTWKTGYLNAIGLQPGDPVTLDATRKAFSHGARNAVVWARRAGSRLHVVAQAPQQPTSPLTAYRRAFGNRGDIDAQLEEASVTKVAHQAMQAFPNAVWRQLAESGGVSFVSFDPVLCDAQRCPMGTALISYYQDESHLSADGSARLVPPLTRLLGPKGRAR